MPPEDSKPVTEFTARMFRDNRITALWCLAIASVFLLFVAFYFVCVRAPADFPVRTIITIKERSGLNEIVEQLHESKVIRSPAWFRAVVILKSGQGGVLAGDYYFDKPMGAFAVASRVTTGNFGFTPAKITFPEGITSAQMSVLLSSELVDFNTAEFLKLAKEKEGYLFPDTYLFMPNAKPSQVIETLQKNFDQKVKTINEAIAAFGKPVKDVVTMASIVEAEARTTETRKIIAGILWKRLSLGMPLQVDAPFEYIIGKNTFQLTTKDLQYDSPYNTYKYKGLPPAAIGNPGLDALIATVTPVKSPYFFYLSDVRGNMHYAKSFEEHVANKEKYLR